MRHIEYQDFNPNTSRIGRRLGRILLALALSIATLILAVNIPTWRFESKMRSLNLSGKTTAQVTAELGPPDESFKDGDGMLCYNYAGGFGDSCVIEFRNGVARFLRFRKHT